MLTFLEGGCIEKEIKRSKKASTIQRLVDLFYKNITNYHIL